MRSAFAVMWIACVAVAAVCVGPGSAGAGDATSFVGPAGWSVGDAGSTYQEWDVLAARAGNSPDVGRWPAASASTLSAALPALRTGAGNLYSYAGDFSWWADVQNVGATGAGTNVLVQVATTLNDGVGVYPASLAVVRPDGSSLLGGDNAAALRSVPLFEGQVWIDAMGQYVTMQERLWEFFLPGYTGDFRVVGTNAAHASLMQVRLDSMVAAVPEPAVAALAGTGAILLGACRLFRRQVRGG